MTGLFDGGPSERVVGSIAGKQPGGGSAQAPPVPQDLEQCRREHHISIPLAFALLDANHHALTVEIAWAEPDRFRDPESGGVARREDGAVLGRRDAIERANDPVGTEHDRQASRCLRRRDQCIAGPGFLEGNRIEEPERADRGLERTGRQVSLPNQVDLIGANLLRAQVRRRAPTVPREPGDVLDVGALCMRGQIPNLHVLARGSACGSGWSGSQTSTRVRSPRAAKPRP
jgi:hypothetical protein